MIPPTDPRASATPQTGPYAPPPARTPTRGGQAHLSEVDHVAELSAMAVYLRALQEHYRAERRLAGRARDAAVRVQALAHALHTTAQPEPDTLDP